MRLTPINAAEAIIEPFWDPQLSGLKEWRVEPGAKHGLRVFQNWCWVGFEWARKPSRGPSLRMSRRCNLSCAAYDRLIVSVMTPEKSVLRVMVRTNRGAITWQAPAAGKLKKEHAIGLHGATRLLGITLEIDARDDGIAAGWFNWIGLQHEAELKQSITRWNRFDRDWESYLKPASYEPKFEPTLGILINQKELAGLRRRHEAFLKKHKTSPFTRAARAAAGLTPEKMIRDFVNFWNDTRYCRERDHGNHLLTHGPAAAIAGLLLKDKQLLRLGARYAMALAMCGRWDDGMICYFPGGNFEHRSFVQSLCVHETALLLDLAGEMFTNLGREYILRRIAEDGLGNINFNVWKHEYIFHCNQLAWFTPGRMLGYATLQRTMPRVRPYLDLAYHDLIESLGYSILSDGGYPEGPTYFRCVGRDGGLSLYYYARAKGLDFKSVIPDSMKRTADFGGLIASTDESQDVIPICDAKGSIEHDCAAVMATALPDSPWVDIFRKAVARTRGMSNTLLACKLATDIPARGPAPKPFVFLPEMGAMASTRKLGDETVKLLIMGNKAGAGHTHEDKGSFVLEFAGETFAVDPGTCDYSSPMAGLLKNCERHNMLIPVGGAGRPHPRSPLDVDVKPKGAGDARQFHARIEATPGWDGFYKKWIRTWDSPRPDLLIIEDEYALAGGNGVEFYWNTRCKIRVLGRTITLLGRRGQVVIEIPADCKIRVDNPPSPEPMPPTRIAIRREAAAGRLRVEVRLSLR